MKHSGVGIASFTVSIIGSLLMFLLFMIAGAIQLSTPGGVDENSPAAMVIGLMLFLLMFALLVALGLGIGALCQSDRKRLFGVLGTIFSAVSLLLTLILLAVGLVA